MFPNKSASALKSIGFAFIILAVAAVGVVLLQATNKTGPAEDIRSHAANPADTVVDSDAVLDTQEQSFQSVNNDQELNTDSKSPEDDADMREINAL